MRVSAILFGLSLGVAMSVSAEEMVRGLGKNVTRVNATTIGKTEKSGSFANEVTKRRYISSKKVKRLLLQRRSSPLILPDIVLPSIRTQDFTTIPELSESSHHSEHHNMVAVAPIEQESNPVTTPAYTESNSPSTPVSTVAPPTVASHTVALKAPPPPSPPAVAQTLAPPPVAIPQVLPPPSVAPVPPPPSTAQPMYPPQALSPTYLLPPFTYAAPKKKVDDDEEEEDEDEDEEDEEDYDADDLKTRRRR